MKVIVVKDYERLSEVAAGIIAKIIIEKPTAVLGLATGTSPIGTYKKLIEYYENGLLSFAKVNTVNLDEYVGLAPSHDQSYHYFMNDNLFSHVDIPKENTRVPDGTGDDLDKNCKDYDAILEKYPRDLQLLGIGGNGHIGFNEPKTPFGSKTHIVELTEKTRQDNSRLFKEGEKVPEKAITMGISEICQAKKVLLVANGKNKADAVYAMVSGKVSEDCPASVLQLHPDAVIVVDKEAAAKLDPSVITEIL